MLNIELPWIDGRDLKIRWDFHGYRELEKLHYCIFELGLPVYDFDRELQEGIVDKQQYDFNDDGEPGFYFDLRNILYFFDIYVNHPAQFDPDDTWVSHALRRISIGPPPPSYYFIDFILQCMFFKMEDVKKFE